jgi:hypothetical protein
MILCISSPILHPFPITSNSSENINLIIMRTKVPIPFLYHFRNVKSFLQRQLIRKTLRLYRRMKQV